MYLRQQDPITCGVITIDHVVMVHDEILCTPLYLGDNLPCFFKNIHQYTSICLDGVYPVNFCIP
jgi:hypothetical protein